MLQKPHASSFIFLTASSLKEKKRVTSRDRKCVFKLIFHLRYFSSKNKTKIDVFSSMIMRKMADLKNVISMLQHIVTENIHLPASNSTNIFI